jgi:ADP-ribose pyrophosphatase YjhB (NUDIX family)
MPIPRQIDWAQKLQAIAQTGLHYTENAFDRERYDMIREIAAEMLEANSSSDAAAIRMMFDAQTGHATPKTDVRGVVFRDNKILLVQEKLDDNRWTVPGGWADIGESAGEAVVREIYEETGYYARTLKLMALYDRNKHEHPPFAFHAFKAFFLCELTDPERHVSDSTGGSFTETGEVGWFGENELPEHLSTMRVTRVQIARFFAHLRHPDLPTDFD